MRGYKRVPGAIAVIMSVIIATCFVVLALFILLHETIPFLRHVSLDAAVDAVWGKAIGAVMFAAVVVLVVALIMRARRQDCIAFDNPEGEVIIAITAIEDFIKRLAKSFAEVRDISPTVVAVDGGVAIEARVALWDDQNIHAACVRIQKAVRGQVQQFFGLANVHTVKVFISRTIARGEPGAAGPATSTDEYAEEPDEESDTEREGG
jgi:hypothetical protein